MIFGYCVGRGIARGARVVGAHGAGCRDAVHLGVAALVGARRACPWRPGAWRRGPVMQALQGSLIREHFGAFSDAVLSVSFEDCSGYF